MPANAAVQPAETSGIFEDDNDFVVRSGPSQIAMRQYNVAVRTKPKTSRSTYAHDGPQKAYSRVSGITNICFILVYQPVLGLALALHSFLLDFHF